MLTDMVPRLQGHVGASEGSPPFLPLSFRLFASFGLLVLHLALPADVRAGGPGEMVYLLALVLFLGESVWESARGLQVEDRLFPTPGLAWIRWNLALDLLLVTLVIAYQGVGHERFSTLYIFPVLASAFYLSTLEIVWIGVLSTLAHIAMVFGFVSGLLPPFGESGSVRDFEAGQIAFLLGLAALQILTATLVVVLIRRNIERLRIDLSATEAAVDELSALHLRVVESMSSGLVTFDLGDRITSANPAAEAILGMSIAAGTPLHALFPLGTPLRGPRGHEQRFEFTIRTPDRGDRILGGHLASLRAPDGHTSGHLLLFQDLTELKALAERTRISERLATVGQLAAGLAHELRNPLASISGCAQLLRGGASGDPLQARVLGILERETQRVNAIVSDFLDFARPGQPERRRILLPRVIEEARASWEMDPRTGGLHLDTGEVPEVEIEADPHAIHRILMNLLSNARKAVRDTAGPKVSVACRLLEDEVELRIGDNGCGMDAGQLERLFVPFAGSFEEGTGLGMSLVFKLAQEMGWRLEVESHPGGGTEIRLILPVFHPSDPVAQAG